MDFLWQLTTESRQLSVKWKHRTSAR